MKETILGCNAVSDMGYGRDVNEDYVDFIVFDANSLFVVLADGMGSKPSDLQPAGIVTSEIMRVMKAAYDCDSEAVMANPLLFVKLAMAAGNRILGTFKIANEERYAGFAASVTCCFIYQKTHICFAHCGNTRLHLIRYKNEVPVIKQLTKDHTKAMKLLEDGIITAEQYPIHPDRLMLTSALGIVAEPEIQYFDGGIKENDLLVMTTKGIHFAIRPEAVSDISLNSGNCADAAKSLIEAAKSQKYIDNMSAVVMFIPSDEKK